jgi:hypothetical protein
MKEEHSGCDRAAAHLRHGVPLSTLSGSIRHRGVTRKRSRVRVDKLAESHSSRVPVARVSIQPGYGLARMLPAVVITAKRRRPLMGKDVSSCH